MLNPEREKHFYFTKTLFVKVDFMLGSYMEDIQITPQQFSDACTKAKIKTQFQQGLFEQVKEFMFKKEQRCNSEVSK